MQHQSGGVTAFLFPLIVIAVVFALRFRRMRSEQRLRLEPLWIVPAIYAVLVVTLLWEAPPASPGAWAAVLLAFVLGAGIGWQRGRTIRITIDPATHQLNQKASPATMLLLVALVLLRLGLRSAAETEGRAWHLDAALITDAFAAMALGLFALTRIEMFLRGRRLLMDARRAERYNRARNGVKFVPASNTSIPSARLRKPTTA